MAVTAALLMVPFYFMFLSSLKPGTEMLRNGLSLTFDPGVSSFVNYEALNTYRDGIYWLWYRSSVIIMVLQTAAGLVMASMVGYGLAMYRFPGRNAVFTLVLILMMVPFEILLLPLYRMLIRARLTDTYFGVILPYLVPPFMIFFFRQYVLGLPRELLEAARIDGCTDYGVFFRIMVPNMIPAFGAMTILSCMNSWNNLLWPLIVLSSNEKFTIPIGMGTTITPYGNAFDVLMPGAVMAVVPIIVIYLFCQKTFIAGMTAGSVKG
ncbi:MAG: carbohydrate ABC transporter permease [Clostridia bacterium]|nr:carbohydrate ABC transporter permease [Clostridia bacterium]